MQRKFLSLLVIMAMTTSLLFGCGESGNTDMGDSTNTNVQQNANNENQDTGEKDSTDNSDNTAKETNKLGMFTGEATGMDGVWETANGKSVVITFDEEKVRISSDCSHYHAWFEYIDDPMTTLDFTLVDTSEQTIQEIYDNALEGKGSAWTKSELYELNVNGMTFQCWDMYLFDNLVSTEFAYEIDNGYIVTNHDCYSEQTDTISQLELLNYVFADIESGGATVVALDEDESNFVDVSQDAGEENAEEEQEEIDTSIYSEKVELVTEEGKKVQVYYDPAVIEYIEGEDWLGNWSIDLGDLLSVAVADAESAKGYIDSIISNNGGYLEIYVQEELQLGRYTVHHYRLNDIESGSLAGEEYIIELDSDVVFTFKATIFIDEDGSLDTEFNAIKFVVE